MFFAHPKISYRIYFIILFLIFGLLIALLTSVINYNLDVRSIQAELDNKADSELARKRQQLFLFTERLEGYVTSLRNSPLLLDYILQPDAENREVANQLFYALSNSNPSLMQVRYLDAQGMEKIRIDWNLGRQWPEIVKEQNLQDKSQRYYFIEASQIPANTFWHSRLDLNVEHKKIEIPYKPVLRIASPVYVNQQFQGIVIINVHAKGFLGKFTDSPFFNIVLADHDGHYLKHYQDALSWSRYLQTGRTLADDYPDRISTILENTSGSDLESLGNLYAASLGLLLRKDQAHLLLIPKDQAIQGMKHESRKAMVLIIGTILMLSIPLSILISRIPARLNQQVTRQNKILQEYVDLIDNNIITSTTDQHGVITEVSTAFCQVSGYSREELIGNEPSMVLHPTLPTNVLHNQQQTIQSGQNWSGELHHQSKNGASYWTEATIFAKYNEDKQIDGYTTIYQDTTDKKRVEKLSITDALTGLYNRRFFNETLKKELSRARRNNKTLCFIMADVDSFKQYNDHYGHQKGDEVLKAIAQTLQQKLHRSSDFCFRLGGEEFGIIVSDLSAEKALALTETIRTSITALAIEHQWGGVEKIITVSFGLLSITPGPGITVDTIYQKADQALYAAKQGGRNRIVSDELLSPS